jgi:lysophospholipase L1-like esterase
MRLTPLRHTLIVVAALVAMFVLLATPARAVTSPTLIQQPKVMAALGDSITRAFNTEVSLTCPTGPSLDCPKNSWSTGTNPVVDSQFLRLQALDPGRDPVAFNDAVTGARASDLARQVEAAIEQNADYVTVLIGANDACRPTLAQQTPTATFRQQVKGALEELVDEDPKVHIQLVSIPNINQLHTLFADPLNPDEQALFRWDFFDICQALLDDPLSYDQDDVERREAFKAQVIAYNGALADVCAEIARCLFDNNAVFNASVTAADVATVTTTGPTADYFHPSLQGQAKLADLTFAKTFAFR